MSCGNIVEHRSISRYNYVTGQLTVFEKTPPKALSKLQFISTVIDDIVAYKLSFSVVEHPEFRNILLSGRGRQNLELPSQTTLMHDIMNLYGVLYKDIKYQISRSVSRLSITFDL